VTLSSTTQDFAVKFHGVGIYRLSFEVQGPGATGRMAADSVKVTVRKPEELYWYGSARGSQSATFDYPLESHASVQINRFPDVAQVGNDNRDATKDKHFLFIHGFNNDVDEARAWSDELYKRLYWTGYRDNYIGITWFGDEGPDWIPGVEAYNFDLDVENALHASPCLYRCIRTRMMSYWHVKSSDINIMAHSLGNLVMWDALRINAHLHPGSRLVNNVISTEAAVWPETFLPEAPVVYNAPGDDAITYDTDQLARHSWTYWFRQAGHEARSSAAYVYHSWVAQDNALYAMRFNDKLFRGMLVPGGREHYYRNNVNSYPHLREPTTLHDTPTLMLHGHRHLSWMGEYDRSDLNLPLGTQVHPEDGNGVESSTPYPSYGWQRTEHSDQKNRPIFLIYQWYKNIVKYGAQIP
jgi:hypothetical protein